ncbi:MAG: MFS transporter [Chloroflexi bacterium]|nr:MFS transporter [Chloroflexota bacterium]
MVDEHIPALSRRQIVLLMAALVLGMALVALDTTLVGTALPTIVAELDGVALYSWLISAYLLTSTVTVPVYGRLADMWGRKPLFLWGIVLFVIGSALCGQAQSMLQLIAFRAIQGLGAGAVQPMAITILGDVFGVEQRARMQALFSAVWGTSGIVGPTLGALIVMLASWHWIFYVSLPIGLLAFFLVSRVYHERAAVQQRSVDVLGACLLTAGVSALLLALQQRAAPNPPALPLDILAFVLLAVFLIVELRSSDPIVPLSLCRRPVIGIGYLVGFLSGATQFGVSAFIPISVQGAMGGTALAVGAVIAPMSIGWPLGSIASGRLVLRVGYKRVLIAGAIATLLGSLGLQTLTSSTQQPVAMAIVALIGLGMGLSSTPVIIAIQNAVDWNQRGVATALTQFSRSIGGSIGAALMGALLNQQVALRLTPIGSPLGRDAPALVNDLLDPARRLAYAEPLLAAARDGLAAALSVVYLVPLVAALLGVVLVLVAFPAGKVEQLARGGPPTPGPFLSKWGKGRR